jgi:hypothetical protein
MWVRDAAAGIGLLIFFTSTFVVTSVLSTILPHF